MMQKQENSRRKDKASYVRGRSLSAEDAGDPGAAGRSSTAASVPARGTRGHA